MRASLLICAKLKKILVTMKQNTEYSFLLFFFVDNTFTHFNSKCIFKILSANLINRSFDVLISCLAIKQKKNEISLHLGTQV